jgi:hypothetical protein
MGRHLSQQGQLSDIDWWWHGRPEQFGQIASVHQVAAHQAGENEGEVTLAIPMRYM